ncbi:autotransporter domain-containing protein [Campylobacter upsaliensis]
MKGLICNNLVKLSHGGGGKKPLLSLVCILALGYTTQLQAEWVHNKPDGSSENGNDLTLSQGGTVNNKNWIVYINASNSAGTLNVTQSYQTQGSGTGGGINVGTNKNATSISIGSTGSLSAKNAGIRVEGTVTSIDIQAGGKSQSTTDYAGIHAHWNSNIQTIQNAGTLTGGEGIWAERATIGTIDNTGEMSGKYGGIIVTSNSRITVINNSGTIKGNNGGKGIQARNGGTIETLANTGTISGGIYSDATIRTVNINNGGSVEGGIYNNNTMGSVSISDGSVTGGINNGSRATMNNITVTNSTIDSITNKNNINGDIRIENGSTITGSITNEKTIGGNISITGTSDVKGSIVNQNGATFNNQITLDQNSKLGGISNNANSTMSGQLNLNGEVGAINNAGKFDSTLTLSNKVGEINNAEGGTISNDITINNGGSVGTLANAGTMQNITNNGTLSNINNSGTMQAITNNGTGTLTLTNSGGTIDKITNGTGATATIRNQGKITNGIINDGGTLTVFNDFRKDESAANGYHTIGEIGKTTNGVHIENKNNGKLHLNAWYFNKEDFTTQEERKNNALLVDGNYAGITLGDVFVNTQGLDVDKTYNANTFIADKDGNSVGDKINNGQGIDVNKLHSVSGIYKFENFGGKGEYRAIINRDELSGKTLAQSIIYSQRVRNVNLSRILREATTQVFVSGKEGEVNGKSLSQLEQLHTNHRDQNSQNHTFVIPYYQNFSADLGNNAKLKSNSSGMLIATQRELPNDYGVLGIYTGFENAEQKVNAQRLDLDGNSYYAGLTYNHSFYEDDLTTYFMNLTTKLDYIERDITKTYLGYIGSASSTAKVFGYGANARVGLSHYLKNDAKITPQIGFNYLGMHSKPFTLNHLGGTREHYYSQNFNFIDAVATIKYETPWINRFKTSLALGTIINVYKDAEGTLHLDNNFLSSELDIARLYGVVQGGISYDLTKDSDISLGYSGIFSSANTIRSHAFMFRYAWWW